MLARRIGQRLDEPARWPFTWAVPTAWTGATFDRTYEDADAIWWRCLGWTLAGDDIGTLTTTPGRLDGQVVGGGGSYASPGGVSWPGGGGHVRRDLVKTPGGLLVISVAPVNSWAANPSRLGSLLTAFGGIGGFVSEQPAGLGAVGGTSGRNAGGGGGAAGPKAGNTGGPGVISDITGEDIEYGRGGNLGATTAAGPGRGSSTDGQTALPGAVYIRWPLIA